jgi:hypothetical protein
VDRYPLDFLPRGGVVLSVDAPLARVENLRDVRPLHVVQRVG